MRIREYYGYALIAGIGIETARHLTPGFILDMYRIRAKHDSLMSFGKRTRKKFFG